MHAGKNDNKPHSSAKNKFSAKLFQNLTFLRSAYCRSITIARRYMLASVAHLAEQLMGQAASSTLGILVSTSDFISGLDTIRL
jgi:hypothetical protein